MSALDQREFQALFAQEAEIRLASLVQLMLQLERDGGSAPVIAAIFREVHTLKGSAAVVGFDDVSRVAHSLEERLEELRSGSCAVTPELIDSLLSALDGLTVLTAQAVARGGTGTQVTQAESAVDAQWQSEVSSATAPAAHTGAQLRLEAGAPVKQGIETGRAQSSHHGSDDNAVVMVPVARLDELVRLVGESATANLRVGRLLAAHLDVELTAIPEFSELSPLLNDLQERTMRTRMVPVATATDQLGRAVRDLARSLGKLVSWEVRGGDTEVDRGVLHQLTDSLLHLVRNAVDHGIEGPDEREASGKPRQATIRLHAMQIGSEVIIAVSDDGRGIDIDQVRNQAARQGVDTTELSDDDALQLVFRSGLSTAAFLTDISGRGVGLDVARASVAAVRGRVEVRSEPGRGSEFRLTVPITLAVLPCLLVVAGGQRFALALHSVVLASAGEAESQAHAEGRPVLWVDGQPVAVSNLAELLHLPTSTAGKSPIVVVAGPNQRHAFQVDGLVGQRDVVVKGLSRLLPRLDVVAGASVDQDGSILVVLDLPGLVDLAQKTRPSVTAPTGLSGRAEASRRHNTRVLVVDDALTVRELQRTILERAGFQVRVACDGIEALARLGEEPSDLVLTDVEMPRMDGFALTEAIRAHPRLSNVPVLVLTSKSNDVDRQRGLEAGADGYIVKSAFDERGLLAAIERLLGGRR
jgi:two-component system chemotaxis sensor kinase CheA